jgi:hypothetical protein
MLDHAPPHGEKQFTAVWLVQTFATSEFNYSQRLRAVVDGGLDRASSTPLAASSTVAAHAPPAPVAGWTGWRIVDHKLCASAQLARVHWLDGPQREDMPE